MSFTPLSPSDLPPTLKLKLKVSARASDVMLDGRYRIGQAIGSGGMGVVYHALDTKTSPPADVVVKLVNVDRIQQLMHGAGPTALKNYLEGMGKRLEREAVSLRKLLDQPHPNVVRVLAWHSGLKKEIDVPYIVMEKLDGEDLAARIERRLRASPWHIDEVLSVARQVASALQHVHAHELIHRDIKPSNLFVRSHSGAITGDPIDLSLVLIDFGIVKDITQVALTVGLPPRSEMYAAPEQLTKGRELEIGPPTDIFSIGVVLAELCFGRPNENTRYQDPDRFPVPTLAGQLPTWFRTLLSDMLSVDPATRPTAVQILHRIDNHRRQMPTAAVSITHRLTVDALNRTRTFAIRAVHSDQNAVELLVGHPAFVAAGGELLAVQWSNILLDEIVLLEDRLRNAFRQADERVENPPTSDGHNKSSGLFSWFRAFKAADDSSDPAALKAELHREVEGYLQQFDRVCRVCGGMTKTCSQFTEVIAMIRAWANSVVVAIQGTPRPGSSGSARSWLRLAVANGRKKLGHVAACREDLDALRREAMAAMECTLTRSEAIYIA